MTRYMITAAEANKVAKELIQLVEPEKQPQAAEMIARLVNLGIRCSPRGVQHTVRLNAVQASVKDLPVKVGMVQRTDEITKRTYNALTIQPIYSDGTPTESTVEDASED